MKLLIVGGAGYIGSHCVLESLRAGHEVVVLDDLRTGHREAIGDVELVEGSLHQPNVLRSVFETHAIDAVFNLAASCSVPESVHNPGLYYHNNLAGTLNLAENHGLLSCAVGSHGTALQQGWPLRGTPERASCAVPMFPQFSFASMGR